MEVWKATKQWWPNQAARKKDIKIETQAWKREYLPESEAKHTYPAKL